MAPLALALTAGEIRASFRRLDPGRYPIFHHMTRDEIHDGGNWMAPGGLVLASMMAERLSLRPGERVLDLGCGRGQSSVFLALQYGVEVVSLDLWVSAAERRQSAIRASAGDRVTPMQGDIARGLPHGFADFDAIFCLQAFHCFGTKASVVRYLASLLRPGGRICIAQGCFREEPDSLPPLFRETDGWHAEYEKYHSPDWWGNHLQPAGPFDIAVSQEVPDGDVLWEDDVLYRGDRARWSEDFLTRSAWLIRQIAHGRTNAPTLTHCLVHAVKGKGKETTR